MIHDVIWTLIAAAAILFLVAVRSSIAELLKDRFARSWRTAVGGHGIRISVEADTTRMSTGLVEFPTSYWFPSGRKVTEPRDYTLPWFTWAHSQGGVDVATSVVEVTIQATADRTVAIDPPRLSSINAGKPAGFVRTPQGLGGGSIQPHVYYFDLDDPLLPPRYEGPNGSGTLGAFRMNAGETERIYIVAEARKDLHRWTAVLPVLVDGRRLHMTVNSRSRFSWRRQSFETIGPSGYDTIYWLMSGNGWSSQDF